MLRICCQILLQFYKVGMRMSGVPWFEGVLTNMCVYLCTIRMFPFRFKAVASKSKLDLVNEGFTEFTIEDFHNTVSPLLPKLLLRPTLGEVKIKRREEIRFRLLWSRLIIVNWSIFHIRIDLIWFDHFLTQKYETTTCAIHYINKDSQGWHNKALRLSSIVVLIGQETGASSSISYIHQTCIIHTCVYVIHKTRKNINYSFKYKLHIQIANSLRLVSKPFFSSFV